METKIHILHLEDDAQDTDLIRANLAEAGVNCRISRVRTRDEFVAVLEDGNVDIILADSRPLMFDGMSALQSAHRRRPDIPFIFVSQPEGEEAVIQALTQGAADYILKPNLSRLAPAVQQALQKAHNRKLQEQAREELRRSNDMLRAIIEAVPVAIIGLDMEGRVHSVWNPAAEKMLGWRAEEVMGRPMPSIPADCQEEFRQHGKQTRNGLTLRDVEVHRQKRDGTPIDYSVFSSPLHDAQGRINGNISVLVEITEKKQAEQQLALMSFALNSIHEIVLMIDEKARLYYVNEEACRLLGYSRDELLTMSLADINPNFSSKDWHDHWDELKKHGTLTIESQHKTKDGRLIPVEFNANYFEYQGRSYDLGLGRNITERQQMERERLANFKFFESMDKVNQAIQGTNDLELMMGSVLDTVIDIFDCDKTNLIFPFNPDAVELSVQMERAKPEYADATTVGITIPITPETSKHLRFSLKMDRPVLIGAGMDLPLTLEQIKAGDQTAIGMAIYPKNSEAWGFAISQCSYPRIWTPEEMTLFEAIGRRLADSLSSLLAYRDLYKSEAFLNSIVENIPNQLFAKDAKTLKYVKFNKVIEQFQGYSRKDLLGKTDLDFFPKEVAESRILKDRQVLDCGELLDLPNETVRNGNNEERILHTKLIPILDETGAPQYLMGISEDITQRKKLEEQLSQSRKMEAIGQLAGGVAHDFNNMLGVIIGRAELALGKAALDDSLRKDLEDILTAGHRSAEITRQLLAFARKQTIMPKILDLNETVEGMFKLLRRLIGEDIDLVWRPGTKLWPIKMDPSQVDQLLANLCVNARDAITGMGKITIETKKIELDDTYCAEHKGFHPGDYVMLAVSDNGSGMDKSTMDKIFEPFFTSKGIGKGTGLGLATVYGIVKQNAGFINAYSEPGHGSTFKIYLPRHSAPEGKEQKPDPVPSAVMGDETILVVEDEAMYLQISKLVLESHGYKVLAASTPSEALVVAKKYDGEIHLLLTDLIMPEMNGRDLSKKIVSLFPNIVCLFMSGYTDNVIVHHGVLEAGIHFIQKPFSRQTLSEKVRELLDEKKGRYK